jgi:LysM repeat protein
MTTPSQPGHGTATITEWNLAQGGTGQQVSPGLQMTVDFDPRSLELRYSGFTKNPGPQGEAGGNQRSKAPSQWMSESTTLSLTLIFDSTDTGTSVQDKTDFLVQLTQPVPPSPGSDLTTSAMVVQFHWGYFTFYGSVTSMSQNIDYFSADGMPLRATVDLTLQEVKPPASTSSASSSDAPAAGYGAGVGIAGGAAVSAGASASGGVSASAGFSASAGASASAGISASVGTTPLTLSSAGDTVQDIAARAGTSVSWKVVAAANNIDNPRMLAAGTVLDLSAGASANAVAGAQVQIS